MSVARNRSRKSLWRAHEDCGQWTLYRVFFGRGTVAPENEGCTKVSRSGPFAVVYCNHSAGERREEPRSRSAGQTVCPWFEDGGNCGRMTVPAAAQRFFIIKRLSARKSFRLSGLNARTGFSFASSGNDSIKNPGGPAEGFACEGRAKRTWTLEERTPGPAKWAL